MIFQIVISLGFAASAQSPVPLSPDSFQLQKLIVKSEEQIGILKEILHQSKRDAASLEKASKVLEDLSSGIEKSIEKYQGTQAHQQALLALQSKNDYEKTYSDAKTVRERTVQTGTFDQELRRNEFEDLIQFQKESVRANQSDMTNQRRLEEALRAAQPGFIPKIEAQAQLGSWQANTRISAQMTELLTSMHAMREELRALRAKESGPDPLKLLMTGAEIQNRKQRNRR